jgi:hypothetical protein
MQNLEGNLDDLFRRAAENYPLKESESRWNEIEKKLSVVSGHQKKGRKKFVLILFFFIVALIMGGILLIKTGNADFQKSARIKKEPGMINMGDGLQAGSARPENNIIKKKAVHPGILTAGFENINHNHLQTTRHKMKYYRPVIQTELEKREGGHQLINELDNASHLQTDDQALISSPEKLDDLESEYRIADEIQHTNPKVALLPVKSKGLYYGLLGGFSFAEVEGQGIKRAGYTAGIAVGYHFNYRLALETGVLFSKRHYYSDGKYFKTSKMPPGMDVIYLEGSSSVFEFPLKLRYNLLPGNKAQFYTSAGISSSILVNETNDYLLLVNGSPQPMLNNYKNTYGYIGSTIDVSITYERKIGRYSTFRIEPYLKIPIRGIGVGSMPVMSTGLQVGVTKQKH